MAEHFLDRPWLVIMITTLLLMALERSFKRQNRRDFNDNRLGDNFILYSLSYGLIALVGLILPGLVRDPGQTLVPAFGLTYWFSLSVGETYIALFLADSFFNYWVHRSSHSVPLLWRIHRVHHTDPAQDVSSAVRNHPFELVPVYLGQLAAIVLVGATPAQVIVVGLIAAVWSLFTHSDLGRAALQFPLALRVLVSPAYHRIHHSAAPAQTDSNYGNMLTIWDHLFGTFRDPASETVAETGLGARYAASLSLRGLLTLPFRTIGEEPSRTPALVRPVTDG